MTLEELATEALKLPVETRVELAHRLILSVEEEEGGAEPEHEKLWLDEIKRRCREIDEGCAELIPADEVLRAAHAALR